MQVSQMNTNTTRENIIDDFVLTVRPHCDAPDDFTKAGAYWLVASTLSQYTYLAEHPYCIPPVPWFVLSSPPAYGRRSTLQKYCSYTYETALRKYYKQKTELGADEIEDRIRMSIIDDGT